MLREAGLVFRIRTGEAPMPSGIDQIQGCLIDLDGTANKGELAAYVVYVGFDPQGATPARPTKQKAAPKQAKAKPKAKAAPKGAKAKPR